MSEDAIQASGLKKIVYVEGLRKKELLIVQGRSWDCGENHEVC